jgi:hypothetical protein
LDLRRGFICYVESAFFEKNSVGYLAIITVWLKKYFFMAQKNVKLSQQVGNASQLSKSLNIS